MSKVRVPKAVLGGLEAVRESALTNMLDRPAVAEIAEEFGFDETARWVRANKEQYACGIFQGFEAEEAD
jgi:hypothetical protein